MIKNVFIDFNGTIINDVKLCYDLLNDLLKEQNKEPITLQRYKEIFTFPIKKYYELAGVDFNIESFDSLAVKFINRYQPLSLNCGLYPDVIEVLNYLKNKNINLFILSASEKDNLLWQCQKYKIDQYFNAILGIDNIHAGSKVEIAKNFIKENNINLDESILIGDTLHDYEVAQAVGIDCRLVESGHQSRNVLAKANVKIYKNLSDIMEEV